MSLSVGKAIYLIAFSSPLVLYTQTHRHPTTHIAYCLLMLIMYSHICSFQIFIYIFVSCLKNQCIIKILSVMEKYYLCSVQSKTNPNQNETILVPVDEVSAFVSSHLRPDCLLIISHCSTFKAIPDEK